MMQGVVSDYWPYLLVLIIALITMIANRQQNSYN